MPFELEVEFCCLQGRILVFDPRHEKLRVVAEKEIGGAAMTMQPFQVSLGLCILKEELEPRTSSCVLTKLRQSCFWKKNFLTACDSITVHSILLKLSGNPKYPAFKWTG